MMLYVDTPLSPADKTHLREHLPADVEPVFKDELPEAERREALRRAEIAFGNPPADWLADAPALRWVQLYSAGFDRYQGVPIAATLTNLKGFFAEPCAETAIAGVLALYRKLDELVQLQQEQTWVGAALRRQMTLLRGKRVVLLGTGSIAQATRRILDGFECRNTHFGRTSPRADLRSVDELKRVLPETDLVINCLPGTDEMDKFFSVELFALLKPDAVFVNVGRGSTVDEVALIDVLRAKRIGGAVLDVTREEPIPPGHPLWTAPNTLLTQHTGGGFAEEDRGKIDFFLENLKRYQFGQPLENVVDPAKGY
jgi:phosphoglycerate dehydrogenase-like enzyme